MPDGEALRAVSGVERPHLFVKGDEVILSEDAGKRRMGVALAMGADVEKAREKARNAIAAITVTL